MQFLVRALLPVCRWRPSHVCSHGGERERGRQEEGGEEREKGRERDGGREGKGLRSCCLPARVPGLRVTLQLRGDGSCGFALISEDWITLQEDVFVPFSWCIAHTCLQRCTCPNNPEASLTPSTAPPTLTSPVLLRTYTKNIT